MKLVETPLSGLYELENNVFSDERGLFVKTFHHDFFEKNNLDSDFKESFYSISNKNVLRGMHYQKAPHGHTKLVYVTSGIILDVVLDIRKGSDTFGHFYSTELSEKNRKSIYIPDGFAHGFYTISESATVVYQTTTVHNEKSDSGILWNSFGFDWGIESPIISDRDLQFKKIKDVYQGETY